MSRWKVFASGQDVAARRLSTAVDRVLGLPTGVEARSHTETHCRMARHSDGRTAVEIDDVVRALQGRVVQVSDGGLRSVTIDVSGAIATLDGWPTRLTDANPWAPRPARDGLP